MAPTPRKILLALLAAAFLLFGATVAYWAYGNAVMWYHNTYVEPDHSAAEADVVLLWIQVPTAMVSLITGGLLAHKVLLGSEKPS